MCINVWNTSKSLSRWLLLRNKEAPLFKKVLMDINHSILHILCKAFLSNAKSSTSQKLSILFPLFLNQCGIFFLNNERIIHILKYNGEYGS